MSGKRLRKVIRQLLLIFCVLKKKKYPAYISKHDSPVKKQIILLMIPNEEEKGGIILQ